MEQRMSAKKRIKAQLGEYTALEAERLQLLDAITKLEMKRRSPSTSKWEDMPRSGSGVSDPTGSGLLQMEGLQARYSRLVSEIEAAQSSIEDMIESLTPTERKLLRHRYIEGLAWEKVCVAMSYCWRQTHTIHSRALDKLVERSKG